MRRDVRCFWTVVCLLCLNSTVIPRHHITQAQEATSVSELWLDISLGPPLVDWFNRIADDHDIARAENVASMDLLDQVAVGRKLIVFRSVSEAERLMPTIADRVDIVGYNLEQGPITPMAEQNDPVTSARRMRALADAYGLELAFGPDHFFALNGGVEIAPYVDIFVLQVQRVQTDHRTVRDFVLPLVSQLHRANPDLEISVQIRTEGNITALVDLVDSMKDELAGVSILTSRDTVAVAEALVMALQTRQDDRPRLAAAATAVTRGIQIETALATESSPAAETVPGEGTFSWPTIILAALIAGVLAGGIVALAVIRRSWTL